MDSPSQVTSPVDPLLIRQKAIEISKVILRELAGKEIALLQHDS